MVEVFKTNVVDMITANRLITAIHDYFTNYRANFDLEDCDRILRVENEETTMNPDLIVNLLEKHGFQAVVLEDS